MEHVTHINKAMVAIFCGTIGWVLFMCTGTSFINVMHAEEYLEFLGGAPHTLLSSQEFISKNIFLRYVGQVGELVLYLLATMSIVEVLTNNECFSFIEKWLRRRSTAQMLWLTVLITFLLSTCIDNLTITVLMLMILRKTIRNAKQRMYIGSAIVIAASAGGCWTVIGDVTSLMLWGKEAVTPTNFSAALILPAIVAMVIPTALIQRQLPERLDLDRPAYSFMGDDSILAWWQKTILFFFGIGGLWFVPSFHRITLLPPFLGALCCLGVVWVLNEIINMNRIRTEQPQIVSLGRSLQYEVLQMIMYCVGVCLCVDVLIECGAMRMASGWLDDNIHNIYLASAFMGVMSSVLDNVALVMSGINLYSVIPPEMVDGTYAESFVQNGQYWHLIALSGNVGGCLLPIGSVAGFALMRAEKVSLLWYLRRISLFAFIGWAASVGTYFLVDYFLR
jgi:Na+/H+ antiporter NhaD/arsenite permease-like protein